MLWQRDVRRTPGGYWYCRDKRRVYNQTRSKQRVAWATARYDSDVVYRISHQLAVRRRKALQRKAERHLPREERGTLPQQGRD